MSIFVGNQEINQIFIGGDITIKQVWYGRKLVWELEYNYKNNMPVKQTIYLTPGVYEIYCVGGGGGSGGAGGGGGSIQNGTGWRAAIGGE